MSNFHRIQWIDNQIKLNKYPNCTKVAKEFEISQRQALRDIEYMKDSLGAPIEYSNKFKGYYYSDTSFTLPSVFITDEQKQALVFLKEQYSRMGGDMSSKLADLFEKLSGGETAKTDEKIPLVKVRDKDIENYRIISNSIDEKTKIRFRYINAKNETNIRILAPYKLFLNFGNVYVVGFCEINKEIRIFRLDRMREIEKTREMYDIIKDFDPAQYIDEKTDFIRISPFIAEISFEIPEEAEKLKFKKEKITEETYKIEFYDSGEMIAGLMALKTKFKINYPSWLREKFIENLKKLIEVNY